MGQVKATRPQGKDLDVCLTGSVVEEPGGRGQAKEWSRRTEVVQVAKNFCQLLDRASCLSILCGWDK